MSLHLETTLAGYARAAVDLRIQMADCGFGSILDHEYLRELLAGRVIPAMLEAGEQRSTVVERLVDVVGRGMKASWTHGETFVLAPAMTAIVAAAAEALDLTGDLLTADVAPCDSGVLFLPEPIYHRRATGPVAAIGAITWTPITATGSGQRAWLIGSWSPLHDPDDPNAAEIRRDLDTHPQLRGTFGPYLLGDFNHLPIAQPIQAAPHTPPVDDADLDWQSTPDGRYVLLDDGMRTQIPTAILYAFWRIQAQPIAVAAAAPVGRPARRRAHRASINHTTRVVMLRRTSPVADPGGEARGTTGSGSSCAATGGGWWTDTASPTGSGSTPTSKDPTAPHCCTGRKSPSSPGELSPGRTPTPLRTGPRMTAGHHPGRKGAINGDPPAEEPCHVHRTAGSGAATPYRRHPR